MRACARPHALIMEGGHVVWEAAKGVVQRETKPGSTSARPCLESCRNYHCLGPLLYLA